MISKLLIFHFVRLSCTLNLLQPELLQPKQLPLKSLEQLNVIERLSVLKQLPVKSLEEPLLEPLEQLHIIERLPEEDMRVEELIRYQGYPVEVHEVLTADGYILTMQRIPRGRNQDSIVTGVKHPVLLQHGLLSSASDWVINFPDQSLGFILADNNYDVWLGNSRGNSYSQKHLTLKPTERKFWDFSWQDMAEYDLPAMINYILNVTASEQLSYVGHSQGTLIAFAKFSQDLAFAEKIRTFFALTPISTVGHIKGPLKIGTIIPLEGGRDTLESLGFYHFGSITWLMPYITQPTCNLRLTGTICLDLIILEITGPETNDNLNRTRSSVYLGHDPDDTSLKNMAHYGQMQKSKKMQQYDYGSAENLQSYGQLTPPEYDVSNMNVSTVAFWSLDDAMADPIDVGILLAKLKNVEAYRVEGFSHIDFIWAHLATHDMYSKILTILKDKA